MKFDKKKVQLNTDEQKDNAEVIKHRGEIFIAYGQKEFVLKIF